MNTFTQAEPIFSQRDEQRKQYWGSYIASPNRPINDCTGSLLKAFNRAIESAVNTPGDHRVLTRCSKRSTMNHLGIDELEIDLDISHTRRSSESAGESVMQYRLIYIATTGVIDIFAPEYAIQSILSHAFSYVFLCQSTVVMRAFSLKPLLGRESLTWDATDGIKSVDIIEVILQDSEWNSRLQIDFPILENAECTLYDHLQNCFGIANPLVSGLFSPIESMIMIHFHGSASPLRISLSLPNQSNLRQHADNDRLLVERCLIHWGVLEESV